MVAEIIKLERKVRWTIRKFASPDEEEVRRSLRAIDAGKTPEILPFEISEFEGNALLNEGIGVLQTLLIGTAGTAFSTANAYLGVGDDDTAQTDPSVTGLLAATNKAYKAMESAYPSITDQTTTWRAIFGTTEGNFDWNEFTVANGSSNAAVNLNRKVSVEGTKVEGQTWTLDLAITWS